MSDIRERIIEIHGADILRKSAMNIRGGAGVFQQCLQNKGYRRALEIGTYRGVSSAEMAQYVERVITIDLKHGRLEQSGENWQRYQFWDSLAVYNVELILVEDDAEKAAVVNGLDFDFAFIDGAHDKRVADDFALVKRCGRVLFHDYDRRGVQGQDDVCDFVDSLPKEQIQKMDIFALWTAP